MRPLLALLAACLAAGCGTADDRRAAEQAVARFYAALRDGDRAGACAQVSAAARDACEAGAARIEVEDAEVVGARVAVSSAVVELRSGQRAFLSRGADGWRIDAAGCAGATRAVPAECEVEA